MTHTVLYSPKHDAPSEGSIHSAAPPQETRAKEGVMLWLVEIFFLKQNIVSVESTHD